MRYATGIALRRRVAAPAAAMTSALTWGPTRMNSVTCQLSISLDGYVAGPDQSLDNPIGRGGMRLHQWALDTDTWNEQHGQEAGERTADSEVVASPAVTHIKYRVVE